MKKLIFQLYMLFIKENIINMGTWIGTQLVFDSEG